MVEKLKRELSDAISDYEKFKVDNSRPLTTEEKLTWVTNRVLGDGAVESAQEGILSLSKKGADEMTILQQKIKKKKKALANYRI
jgi:hypothetical protein